MNNDSYNGYHQALLDAPTEQDFIDLFQAHHSEFETWNRNSGHKQWRERGLAVIKHIAVNDWISAARAFNGWTEGRFSEHGILNATSETMVNSIVVQTCKDGGRVRLDHIGGEIIPSCAHNFIRAQTDESELNAFVQKAGIKGLLNNLLLVKDNLSDKNIEYVMFYSFLYGHLDISEHFYTTQQAHKTLHHFKTQKPNNTDYIRVENYLIQRLQSEADYTALSEHVAEAGEPAKRAKM